MSQEAISENLEGSKSSILELIRVIQQIKGHTLALHSWHYAQWHIVRVS
jgi:hypothetical protein